MKSFSLAALAALSAVLALGGSALAANAGSGVSALAAADDAPGVVVGTEIARAKGGFLGLALEDGHFKLSFYNAKKKPIPVDVARAALRWSVHYQPNDERTVLLPSGDGLSLGSPKTVRPPLSFQLHIGLFAEGSDDAVESYVIDFHG